VSIRSIPYAEIGRIGRALIDYFAHLFRSVGSGFVPTLFFFIHGLLECLALGSIPVCLDTLAVGEKTFVFQAELPSRRFSGQSR